MPKTTKCVRSAIGRVILCACSGPVLMGQAPRNPAPVPGSAPLVETKPAPVSLQAVREIDDPHTGDRWLLERGAGAPGGPGRLVRVGPAIGEFRQSSNRVTVSHPLIQAALPEPQLPVIRPGDRLVIEENTPIVEARLAAVALCAAQPGAVLNARLEIGGKVVRARALGPGRAELEPQPMGGQP